MRRGRSNSRSGCGGWLRGWRTENNPDAQRRVGAFKQGLQSLNWREGQNIKIEYRWAVLDLDRIHDDATSLVALDPDVIVTTGAPTVAALHQVTRSIPIVFTFVTDPVRDGFVTSLSHPGGNITGFAIFEHTMAGKWLEMLKEAAPHITRVAVMQNPEHPAWPTYLNAIATLAPTVGVQVTPTPVHDAAEIEHAISAFANEPNGGLIVLPSGIAINYRDQIIARRCSIAFLRSSRSAYSPKAAGSSPTVSFSPKCTGWPPPMPIAS